jgi:hypothetical protein
MAPRDLVRQVVPSPLRRGAWKAAVALERGQQATLERWLGVSTSGRVDLEELDMDTTDRAHYEGCQWLPVRRALRTLRPGSGDVLADLGCGKGQALLIAGPAVRPGGRGGAGGGARAGGPAQRRQGGSAPASGGERSHHRGRARVARARRPDGALPLLRLRGEVFHRALGALFASYDRAPRRLHVVYDYPWEHDWLMGTERVRLVDVFPSEWPAKPWWWRSGKVITVYQVVGPGEGGPGRPHVRRRWLRPRRALDRWSGPNGHRFKLVRDGEITRASRP